MDEGLIPVDQLRSVLEIRLNGNAYAVPVEFVREINQVVDITPLPNSAAHVCGLMNLRGQVIPVIDLNVRLGQPRTDLSRETCVVVVDGLEGVVGMLVDAVMRVINIPKSQILPTPDNCHLQYASLVTAIADMGDRMITLLDVLHCLESHQGLDLATEGDLSAEAVKLLS